MKYNKYLDSKLNLIYEQPILNTDDNSNTSQPKVNVVKNKETNKSLEYLDTDVENILLQIALDGIVFNVTKAEGPSMCKCTKTTKGTLYCFKSGIIGALSQSQIKEYCPSTEQSFQYLNVDENILDKIKKISQECNISNTETLQNRLKCIYNKAEQEHIIK
ncbi:MAG: hypothetical protein QXE05_06110 [Nitrososphaeria archaeon]